MPVSQCARACRLPGSWWHHSPFPQPPTCPYRLRRIAIGNWRTKRTPKFSLVIIGIGRTPLNKFTSFNWMWMVSEDTGKWSHTACSRYCEVKTCQNHSPALNVKQLFFVEGHQTLSPSSFIGLTSPFSSIFFASNIFQSISTPFFNKVNKTTFVRHEQLISAIDQPPIFQKTTISSRKTHHFYTSHGPMVPTRRCRGWGFITASSNGMATASNDGSVKLWSFDGAAMVNGWFISWKIPCRNGGWLGVYCIPPFFLDSSILGQSHLNGLKGQELDG